MANDDNVVYVMHVCKNRACCKAWVDVDKYNARDYPPRWRYCAECVAAREKGELGDACK